MSYAFDSREADRLSRALELAWQKLNGARLPDHESEAVAKSALAKGIIEAAEQGERDEPALASHAVTHYRRWMAKILEDRLLNRPS
jgi:hypothetical protein